jgi:hypothetical protein
MALTPNHRKQALVNALKDLMSKQQMHDKNSHQQNKQLC